MRYSDCPTSAAARLVGMSATVAIAALILAGACLTLPVLQTAVAPREPLVLSLQPLAAPPEIVQDVAPGPQQTERRAEQQKRDKNIDPPPPLPLPTVPRPSPPKEEETPPVENADSEPPVPETTAPPAIAAPAASRLSNDARPSWEGLLLAHLEKFRRYPAQARANGVQGTVHIRFTMTRMGRVLKANIVRKSGDTALDREALATLLRAQPLPALPRDRPDLLDISVPIQFSLDRAVSGYRSGG